MNDSALFSIVIPLYNKEKKILDTIDSVLAQSHCNFEILIVDDGSTDNTRDILDKYIRNERVQYFYQENNV